MKKTRIVAILLFICVSMLSGCENTEQKKYAPVFSIESGFFSDTQSLSISDNNKDSIIYYTINGDVPTEDSIVYTEPIVLVASDSEYPLAYTIRAISYYDDGSTSDVVSGTYILAENIDNRFSTLVFSIVGRDEDIVEEPDGILVGENYIKRGLESERHTFVTIFDSEGNVLDAQDAGVRVFGAYSRSLPIKSLKLYARKRYDQNDKTFSLNVFGTKDKDGDIINNYKRLVLRNGGNDFTHSYIRDELIQRLVNPANDVETEGVIPAVAFVNGQYYGCFWLHENFCDDFLKDKYGGNGYYAIIEGNEQIKDNIDISVSEYQEEAEEFQRLYEELSCLDMTQDENYKKVCQFIDVDNYITYFAINIYINNSDWPFNNVKCYRYYSAEDEEYETGKRDGKWRFICHDMDFSTMIYYGGGGTGAYADKLALVLEPNDSSYSPLFANLMKRDDVKEKYIEITETLSSGVFSPSNVDNVLSELSDEREPEMQYYIPFVNQYREEEIDPYLWSEEWMNVNIDLIKDYFSQRPDFMKNFIENDLK